MTRFSVLQEIENIHFLPLVHPDASGGTFRIYRKKKQEIHDKDTNDVDSVLTIKIILFPVVLSYNYYQTLAEEDTEKIYFNKSILNLGSLIS